MMCGLPGVLSRSWSWPEVATELRARDYHIFVWDKAHPPAKLENGRRMFLVNVAMQDAQ